MRTEISDSGRVIVIDEFSSDTPQAFTVCIKNPSDWEEIHNYIINENEIDQIPNRKISCISEMQCSTKRSVYEMSVDEAEVLGQHPKVERVERSRMYNPVVIEQAKYDQEFAPNIDTFRYRQPVKNIRHPHSNPMPNPRTQDDLLDFTQWGLLRHSKVNDNDFFVSAGVTTERPAEDIKYSLTGKNVDVVIMDTGIRWDHPEFLGVGHTSVPVGVSTASVSRVRDILIHGESEYSINWSSHGLTAPGTGSLSNYTIAGSLLHKRNGDANTNYTADWHGSHCAGIAAGNNFGAAFEANLWAIACIDRSDLGWSDSADGFDYIKVWHKNKPVNPATGRKNPTIVNCSWGKRQFVRENLSSSATFRGTTVQSSDYMSTADGLAPGSVDTTTIGGVGYYQFTAEDPSAQTDFEEVLNDSDCDDLIFVISAGNSGGGNGKQEVPGGPDYDNRFVTGTFAYSTYSKYYCRTGSPTGTVGSPDAPINVGSLDSDYETNDNSYDERKSGFSNCGPAIDVWSAGSKILAPYSNGFFDPRNSEFGNNYLSGTSMAAPNVVGVLALYLETNPSATRVDVRNWLMKHGTVEAPLSDRYPNPIGIAAYWGYEYALRDSPKRVLYNPFANNTTPKITGVNVSSISFKQS